MKCSLGISNFVEEISIVFPILLLLTGTTHNIVIRIILKQYDNKSLKVVLIYLGYLVSEIYLLTLIIKQAGINFSPYSSKIYFSLKIS